MQPPIRDGFYGLFKAVKIFTQGVYVLSSDLEIGTAAFEYIQELAAAAE